MRAYGGTGLFAGLPETVDQVLGVSKYTSKRASHELNRRGIDARSSTLPTALFELLDRNWALGLRQRGGRSVENFRWHRPQCYVDGNNPSREVSFERALIFALVAAGRTDWSNQVPLISGFGGPGAFRRRAVDLVRRHTDDCFEFVELKMDSDTPVFAAVEILVYGLLWLLSRREREALGYRSNPILDARTLRLSVLAPHPYYSGFPVKAFGAAINEGLHTVALRLGVSMDFRFMAFPSAFYWSSQPDDQRKARGSELIAFLDDREDV